MAIVFIHGLFGDHSDWDDVISDLKTSHPIHFFSPYSYDSIEDCINGLSQFLSDAHLEKADFIGYSLGGRMALSFSHRYPNKVHSLHLISSSLGLSSAEERQIRLHSDQQLANKYLSESPEVFFRWWYSQPLFGDMLNQTNSSDLLEKRWLLDKGLVSESITSLSVAHMLDYSTFVQNAPFPLFYYSGEQDKKYCAVESPNKTIIPNCAHHILFENSKTLAEAIESSLSF